MILPFAHIVLRELISQPLTPSCCDNRWNAFYDRAWKKAQPILYVLASIFDRYSGKATTERTTKMAEVIA